MTQRLVISKTALEGHVFLSPEGKQEELSLESTELDQLVNNERESAYLEGKKEGELQGYEKARAEIKALFSLLQNVTGKILEQKKRLLEHLKPELIEFSFVVCERIIRQELSCPEKLVKMIDSLLVLAKPSLEGDIVKVYLSPDDMHLLTIVKDNSLMNKEKNLYFCSDPLMRRGDCRIETKTGLLNCSICREIEDLKAKVLRQS